MSKGLEALERIKETPTIYCGCGSNVYTRQPWDIVAIEKELKALEIINNKTISACNCLMILKSRFDNLSYKNYKELFITDLTQEEYDLLKEVLL